jgi:hypothetical protein
MKRNIFVVLAGLLFCISCDGSGGDINLKLRTADPCDAWARPGWQEGPGRVVTPELRNGNASHDLWPAELIYYSVIENSDVITPNSTEEQGVVINPVLILVYLENQKLLSQGKMYGDFELRLLRAVGYAEYTTKYNGFYPQLVASTYQWRLFQERKQSFEEAQERYPFLSEDQSEDQSFQDAYADYAEVMNEIAGTNFELYPADQGYYQDFFGFVGIEEVQRFLERLNSLLREDLFNQPPVFNTVIDYSNMTGYCEKEEGSEM